MYKNKYKYKRVLDVFVTCKKFPSADHWVFKDRCKYWMSITLLPFHFKRVSKVLVTVYGCWTSISTLNLQCYGLFIVFQRTCKWIHLKIGLETAASVCFSHFWPMYTFSFFLKILRWTAKGKRWSWNGWIRWWRTPPESSWRTAWVWHSPHAGMEMVRMVVWARLALLASTLQLGQLDWVTWKTCISALHSTPILHEVHLKHA